MTPVFAVRRRADEFASLVEGSSTSATDTRYAEFLEVVASLRSTTAPEARPEFVASLREQLMSAADTLLVPGDEARLALPVRTRSVRDRRIAAAVGGFALVGATTSMAMAAQSALPGDTLYPLKRAIENAEAGLSINDGQKGFTLLATASGRLDEVTALSREGDAGDGTAIAETLNTFTEQATEASDLLLADYAETGHESSISELLDFTGVSMETLSELEALVPAEARDELLHAARVLSQIDAEAAQACPDCGGAGITEIPAILTSSAGYSSTGAQVAPANESDPSGDGAGQPEVPETDGTALPPGSVLNPDTGGTGDDGGTQDGDGQQDPITSLAEGLADGDSQPAASPSGVPGLPDVTGTVDETVTDVTGSVTGSSDGEKKRKRNRK